MLFLQQFIQNIVSSPKYQSRPFDIWLIVVSVLFAVLFILTPPGFDDYTYLLGSDPSMGAAGRAEAVWSNCTRHWMMDTGRLANLLLPVFLGLLPKWVFSIISGLFFYVTVRCLCSLARVPRGSFYSWLAVVPVVFLLPWFDYMFTTVFAINYLWPSAFTLLFLCILKSRVYARSSGVALVLLCLFSASAGWMHEGFTVPVSAGLIAAYLYRRHIPTSREWAVLLSYSAGGVLIVLAPAFWHRAAIQQSLFTRLTLFELAIHGIAFNLMYIFFMLLLAVVMMKGTYRRLLVHHRYMSGLTIFVAVSATVASVIYYRFYAGPRLGWFATLFCTLGATGVFSLIHPAVGKRFGAVVKWIVMIIVPVHLAWAIAEQYSLFRENDKIVSLYLQSAEGEVFFDNRPIRLSGSLMKTSVRNFNEYAPTTLFSAYWNNTPRDKMLSLLPAKLSRFTSSRAVPCESDSTLFLFDGALVCRDSVPGEFATLMVKTPQMGWIESRMRPRQFHPLNDSSAWVLVIPHIAAMTHCDVTDARWIK